MKASSTEEFGVATMRPETPVVEFRDVSFSYTGEPVLRRISFRVTRGEQRIVLGPAGCGKSTLMKLANGLLMPDAGEVCVFGRSLATLSEAEIFALRAHVGMVFQESALFDSLTVEENVAYRLREEGVPEGDAHRRVEEALKFVELSDAIAKTPPELSGGMRRRVSIARAIISAPDLILYDSPTGGLDPITSNTIIELVAKQRDTEQTTSLLVTHRLQDAFALATHRFNQQTGHMQPLPAGEIETSTRFLVLRAEGVAYDGDVAGLVNTTDPWLRDYLR